MEKPADFVIKAHDCLAVDTIQDWVARARELGVNDAKIEKALNHRSAIRAWQNKNMQEVKKPD